jgi:hypothetical protein
MVKQDKPIARLIREVMKENKWTWAEEKDAPSEERIQSFIDSSIERMETTSPNTVAFETGRIQVNREQTEGFYSVYLHVGDIQLD